MYLNDLVIETISEDEDVLAEIIRGLQFLCGTAAGTFPMNRDFGIDMDILDHPLPAAKQLLAIEYQEKIERYESRVDVADISFSYDDAKMQLTPHILISLADGWDDAGEEDDLYDDLDVDEDDM